MTTCPTCLRTLSVCDACGEPLAAASVGVWRRPRLSRQGSLVTRQHRHYHPPCAPAEEPARERPAPPPRPNPQPAPAFSGPLYDRCDVCHQRLPVAELAYRTVPPRRTGGTETCLVGHQACLDRTSPGSTADSGPVDSKALREGRTP